MLTAVRLSVSASGQSCGATLRFHSLPRYRIFFHLIDGKWNYGSSQFGIPGGPELLIILIILIIGLLFLILPFVLAYWVYTDAEQRGNENAALWALAVGGLTFLTFFGGLLALAVYIWDRE